MLKLFCLLSSCQEIKDLSYVKELTEDDDELEGKSKPENVWGLLLSCLWLPAMSGSNRTTRTWHFCNSASFRLLYVPLYQLFLYIHVHSWAQWNQSEQSKLWSCWYSWATSNLCLVLLVWTKSKFSLRCVYQEKMGQYYSTSKAETSAKQELCFSCRHCCKDGKLPEVGY